tara:strand:- start:1987 stop:2178 length:192 start_codon:yes stop_codon:yes gene_type:complete
MHLGQQPDDEGATVGFVRTADRHPPKMLHDEPMAALETLHRSARTRSGRQVRVGSDEMLLCSF